MVTDQLRKRGLRDERVLSAMERVPREEFVAEEYRSQAYEDHPLPIGEKQTISQPYIVASMLEAVAIQPSEKVLEIGAGSGYVTALLAEIAREVFAVERHAALASKASEMLDRLHYSNAQVILGDGSQGLAEHAPFDVIVVSAAAPELPPALIAQLAEGGRMIIPVGVDDSQQLQLIEKRDGQLRTALREFCRFVPLISGKV